MSQNTDFNDWVGKSETESGVASAYSANYFTVTLDRDDAPLCDGDELPPGMALFLFP